MTPLIIAVSVMAACLFFVQVLKTVDLPRYRPHIFKIYLVLTLWAVACAAWGVVRGRTAGASGWAMAAVGVAGAVVGAQRSHRWHVLRHEFDLPPHLTSRAPEVKVEGPSAQAAKRKAARLAGETPEGGTGA